MKVDVLDALHFIVKNWHCVTCMTIVNCFHTCLNQSIDAEVSTKCIASKYGGNHLKEGVSFPGDIFCGGVGGGGVMREGHTIGHVMDETFTCDVCEEGGGMKMVVEKVYFWQHFCQHWRATTL
jgi:hypothetical protein